MEQTPQLPAHILGQPNIGWVMVNLGETLTPQPLCCSYLTNPAVDLLELICICLMPEFIKYQDTKQYSAKDIFDVGSSCLLEHEEDGTTTVHMQRLKVSEYKPQVRITVNTNDTTVTSQVFTLSEIIEMGRIISLDIADYLQEWILWENEPEAILDGDEFLNPLNAVFQFSEICSVIAQAHI